MKTIKLRRNDTGETSVLRNVSRIRTHTSDGMPCTWIEEDEADKTASIDIEKNGTYKAHDLNLYGFSSAHVNIDFTKERTTQSGVTYRIYLDSYNRPHISVLRKIT